jgi:hypothetical protein
MHLFLGPRTTVLAGTPILQVVRMHVSELSSSLNGGRGSKQIKERDLGETQATLGTLQRSQSDIEMIAESPFPRVRS